MATEAGTATRPGDPYPPVVERLDDLVALDGQPVTACGRYRAIPEPRKGPPAAGAPRDRAVLELSDGEEVFIEPMNFPAALRPADERERFDGKRVCVSGIARKVMPSLGESLIDPCIEQVSDIRDAGPDLRAGSHGNA